MKTGAKNRYGAIDGLRTIACFGIVLMHMAANNEYAISGFIYESLIPAFTNFVFLFMTVSAFGMCCGYYDKMLGKNVDGTPQIRLTDFYKKRFMKVLPFFAVLCLLDFVLSPSLESLYEVFADITLVFGLLPNAGNISVIGVGWFLGLIFVFYLIFPFFCVLIENKRRAWISFGVSLIYSIGCAEYFGIGRTNILYSGSFLLAGGLIYLYKDEIGRISENTWTRWLMLGIVSLTVVFYFAINSETISCLLVSTALLLYVVMASKPLASKTSESMRGGYKHVQYSRALDHSFLLENRFTAFISGVSMEIYLSHMVIFRVVEKIGLNTILGTGWLQYIATVLIVLIGATVFAFVIQKLISFAEKKITELMKKPA